MGLVAAACSSGCMHYLVGRNEGSDTAEISYALQEINIQSQQNQAVKSEIRLH